MARPMKRPPVTAGAGAADTNGNQERRPVCWMSFCRKESTSPPRRVAVPVPNARWRVGRSAVCGLGWFGGSALWQYDDYGCVSECEVYEDYQCECRGDQCERVCMSGVSHVLSLLSGVCVCDLPIVSDGDGNATPECVGSVSSLLRKERRGECNSPPRARDVTAARRMACAVGARVGMSVGRATNDRRAA
jgi:hypothetical protein